MELNILHISDIHFGDELPRQKVFRHRIVERIHSEGICSERKKADCLIISGDLFNRGSLEKLKIDEYKRYINGFCCEKKLIVPGNHDLDREARTAQNERYNGYNTRRSIALEKGESVYKNGARSFEINDVEKPLLYDAAFEAFFSFSEEMGFKSYNMLYKTTVNDIDKDVERFEVEKIDLPIISDDDPCGERLAVRFILLNTALIAGQAVRDKEYKKRIAKIEEDAQQQPDEVEAAKTRVKSLKLKKELEEYGELIIDEEKKVIESGEGEHPFHNSVGRLSLSARGMKLLLDFSKQKNTKDGERIVAFLFVGHHGVEYLSDETQHHLAIAMKNCNSGIYLCGHAHKESTRTLILYGKQLKIIQAGVLFEDDNGVAQYGFNHIKIGMRDNMLKFDATAHFYVSGVSGELCWMKEKINTDGCIYSPDNPSDYDGDNTADKVGEMKLGTNIIGNGDEKSNLGDNTADEVGEMNLETDIIGNGDEKNNNNPNETNTTQHSTEKSIPSPYRDTTDGSNMRPPTSTKKWRYSIRRKK